MDKIKKLDQFYTKPNIALSCWLNSLPIIYDLTGKTTDDLFFIEPSAGNGVFYNLLPEGNDKRMGIDIDPQHKEIIKDDFLSWNNNLPYSRRDIIVIGNPPFGKRGNKAVSFLNKAASISNIIIFIVPIIFRKFFIHKQITQDLKWIYSLNLPRSSFSTLKKNNYPVNTELQIWTRFDSRHKDYRLLFPPPINHKDFDMNQYNNTKSMLKVFNNKFDFAVPCQGWQDYTRKETDPNKCEKQKQWILFNAHKTEIRERLYNIDFSKLAMKNTTSVPGFRKGDVVQEYIRLYK